MRKRLLGPSHWTSQGIFQIRYYLCCWWSCLAKWSPRCNHFSNLKKVNLEQTNFGAEAHAEGPLAETKRKKWGKKKGVLWEWGSPLSWKSRALTEAALTRCGQSRQWWWPESRVYKVCSQGALLLGVTANSVVYIRRMWYGKAGYHFPTQESSSPVDCFPDSKSSHGLC